MFKKDKNEASKDHAYVAVESMLNNLKRLYSNKSDELYKCKGDISKSPSYYLLEARVANLSSVKKYPAAETQALKNMFNVLHRPIFNKMVMEFLNKPEERNIIFTAFFTTGYRVLAGELARVFTSVKATDKGFIYHPDKISRKESTMKFIKKFNNELEKGIDDMIKREHRPVQEAAILSAVTDVANLAVGMVEGVFGVINGIFRSAASLNPISFMSAILTRSYDKKVEKFQKVAKEYEVALKLYEDYKKLPETNRRARQEHKYAKIVEKYNIKMEKLKAEIDHYDMRAKEEAEEDIAEIKKKKDSKKTETQNNSDSKDSDSSSDDNSDNDGFDF